MSDIAIRVVLVLAIVGLALIVAVVAARLRQPVHPPVSLEDEDLPTGVVLFTSTDCDTCAAAREALKSAGVPYREVTWELEGDRLERLGIEGVPLIVMRDTRGRTVAQLAGTPRRRPLRHALAVLEAASDG